MNLFHFHRYFKRSKNLDDLKEYLMKVKIGDWFVLYQMSKNLNRKFFYDFLIKLSKDDSKPEICESLLFLEEEDKKKQELKNRTKMAKDEAKGSAKSLEKLQKPELKEDVLKTSKSDSKLTFPKNIKQM